MGETLKIKYKIGEIEFEAEGSAADVEQQRQLFMEAVLPAAVNAMAQTHVASAAPAVIAEQTHTPLLEAPHSDVLQADAIETDLSRTSLSAFLKQYGTLSDQDFVLFAAYFDKKRTVQKLSQARM